MPSSPEEHPSGTNRMSPPVHLMQTADEHQIWMMSTLMDLAASFHGMKTLPGHIGQMQKDMSSLRGQVDLLKDHVGSEVNSIRGYVHNEIKSLHERLDPVSSGYTRMDEKWKNQSNECSRHQESMLALERRVDGAIKGATDAAIKVADTALSDAKSELKTVKGRNWTLILAVVSTLFSITSSVVVGIILLVLSGKVNPISRTSRKNPEPQTHARRLYALPPKTEKVGKGHSSGPVPD